MWYIYLGPVYQAASTVSNITFFGRPLLFDQIQFGYCSYSQADKFDITTGIFQISTTALYWFHLSLGIPSYTKALYGIQLTTNDFLGINKTNTAYPNDQVTTDALCWVSSGSKLSITTTYNIYNSGQLTQTSWLWLKLDSFITPLVAFHVALTTSFSPGSSVDATVPFNKVFVNEGGGWNSATYKFSPPMSGIYYISFGAATTSGKRAAMTLRQSSQYRVFSGMWESSLHNGLESNRASVLLNVATTDFIFCSSYNGHYYEGNSNNLNYLMGFLYNPSSFNKIAWSVGRSLGGFTGPVDNVQFNVVYVSSGISWNSTTSSVIITVSGSYIVDITCYLCGTGKGNGNENMQLLLNGNPIIELKLTSFIADDCVTRSRTVATQLKAGNQLTVRALIVGSYYGFGDSQGRQFIVYSGFLINPLA